MSWRITSLQIFNLWITTGYGSLTTGKLLLRTLKVLQRIEKVLKKGWKGLKETGNNFAVPERVQESQKSHERELIYFFSQRFPVIIFPVYNFEHFEGTLKPDKYLLLLIEMFWHVEPKKYLENWDIRCRFELTWDQFLSLFHNVLFNTIPK